MNRNWIAIAAIMLGATTLHGAEPITPTDKPNVLAFIQSNFSGDIEYRRLFLNSRVALIALAGYHDRSTKSSGPISSSSSSHMYELGLGVRRNFAVREQLRPFVQFAVSRSNISSPPPCVGSPSWNYTATGGGEYFVGRRVSLEGSAGVNVGRFGIGCDLGNGGIERTRYTTVDTFRTAVGINFYF